MSQNLSMYQASIPVLQRALSNLKHLLRKGEAHAFEQGQDPAALLRSQLYPDMYPLLKQVQLATDSAKFAPARLAGVESPHFPDDETSFADLHARLDRAIDYLGTFTPAQIDGSEDRTVVLTTPTRELQFDGRGYLLGFVLPNVFFHVSMVHAILRHSGVPIGKRDYLGAN